MSDLMLKIVSLGKKPKQQGDDEKPRNILDFLSPTPPEEEEKEEE